MSRITMQWSSGSRDVVTTEGLRYIVLQQATLHLIYGSGWTTSYVGPGHDGRQVGTSAWNDAEKFIQLATGQDLLREVIRYRPMSQKEKAVFQAENVPLEEADEIVFHRTRDGWATVWHKPHSL